jgi:hypothetical protein
MWAVTVCIEKESRMQNSPVSTARSRNRKTLAWARLATLTILTIYLFIFFEWLFNITKPSFMQLMPWWTQAGIFLFSGLILSAASLVILLIPLGLSLIPRLSRFWKAFLWIGGALPTAALAATALIAIDNFTYTVFRVGIVTAQKPLQRGAYMLLLALLLFDCGWWVMRTLNRQARTRRMKADLRVQIAACGVICGLAVVLGGMLYSADPTTAAIPVTGSAKQRPNILLIGTDSVSADHMSLYGAQRDTTPFLKTFAQQALLAENNFPNVNETAGSLISILTGKLPSDTRVLYPPDILQGSDAYEHFPGILKNEGYYNAEISVDYYGDATVLNLQNGFDLVNGRSKAPGAIYTQVSRYIPGDAAYFLNTAAAGLTDRLLDVTFIRSMPDPYAEVSAPLGTTDMNDQPRVDQVLTLFRTIQQPLFIHVYMMGTHLGSLDGYDDAIQGFDGYMQQVVNALQKMGKLDQTMIIVYTDNGVGDVANVRIPLLIRFPHGQYAGKLNNNTQNIDIAPTILDYLGIPQPGWMVGQSLLKGEPPAARPIFSASPNYLTGNSANELQIDLGKIKPPFNQFGTFGMVICQKSYSVDTAQLTWSVSDVPGESSQCNPNDIPSEAQAKQMLLNRLKADGFDITSLATALDIQLLP